MGKNYWDLEICNSIEHASELFLKHCDKVIINLRVFPHKHARNSKDDLAKIVTLYNKGEAAQ